MAALILGGALLAAAQGSVEVIAQQPSAAEPATAQPTWLRWCTRGTVRLDRVRLAFCARVDGHVLASTHGPGPAEAHVAVLSDFHLFVVRLRDGARVPSFGTRIAAIGPLVRARDGQREIQAFAVDPR